MDRLLELSRLFALYKTYPIAKYVPRSPLRCFQQLYPNNYYTSQMELFLQEHHYAPAQRGADLPWWGQKYFTSEPGYRVLIVSQDSLSGDAGSVVFFSFLYSVIRSKEDYLRYTQCLDDANLFRFASWKKIYDQLNDWHIDLNYCYITDAAKVYKKNSWKDRDFDKVRSKILLDKEIELCKPDFLILLGSSPLALLKKSFSYGDVVGKKILINGFESIVSPFLTGNAPAQPNFKERLEAASRLIKTLMAR